MTAFDWIDLFVCLAVVGVAIAWKRKEAQWAVGSFCLYHVFGRIVVDGHFDPVISLAMLQTIMAGGYLASRYLSLYGVAVGCIFALMSISSCYAWVMELDTTYKQGLGFDLWNFQSLCLHVIAVLIMAGTIRYDRVFRISAADR
jgi:hypothetical protein